MFEITVVGEGRVLLAGRLDASQEAKAGVVFDSLHAATVVDLEKLDYIASMGLGLLLKTQKRLKAAGAGLILVNVNPHILEILRFSGFHQLFEIRGDSP